MMNRISKTSFGSLRTLSSSFFLKSTTPSISSLKNVKGANKFRYFSSTVAQVVKQREFGNPQQVLKLEQEPIPENLEKSQVLVKMLASPINPSDLNMVEGVYGTKTVLPYVPGNEGVGVVLKVGSNVKGISVNDRVILTKMGLGAWRTIGVFDSQHLQTIPGDIPVEYAGSLCINPTTALRLLEDFEKLQPGDTIIQNAANSMVGTSIIQIAKERGINTINIIRDRPELPETVEKLKGIGATLVVTEEYAKTAKFQELISDLPKPKLAINAVGGSSATELARNLREGGSLVTYGGMSHRGVTVPTSLLIFKDIKLRGFWLARWMEQHSEEEKKKMFETIYSLIRDQKLKLWIETWDFSKFPSALSRALEPQKGRKIMLVNNN